MEKQGVLAVFEGGSFRPLGPIVAPLAEGQRVRLVVESLEPIDVLDLAAGVYEGLTDSEVAEVEAIALDRGDFFRSRGGD